MWQTVFVRDEIVLGYNDRCRVIPAGRDPEREKQHRTYVSELARLALAHAARSVHGQPARDSVSDFQNGNPVKSDLVHRAPVGRLDRAIANLEQCILDAPNAGPSISQMMEHNQTYTANQARICAEAKAAYAARNPHKREMQAK